MIHFKMILILLVISSLTITVTAEKLSLTTHNQLIGKLEAISKSSNTSDGMVSSKKIELRLADLYSERARLLSIENEGKGEILFKSAIQSDREKALQIYEKQLSSLFTSERDRIYLQVI
ncbi:MAG: hypothetical protein L6Q37_15715, partial [Bdellovibrionaceae bacterium]|nr:hypothetical protein [Pseudobdellovibrionaceae bacterium]